MAGGKRLTEMEGIVLPHFKRLAIGGTLLVIGVGSPTYAVINGAHPAWLILAIIATLVAYLVYLQER